MRFISTCLCLAALAQVAVPAPARGFVFPEERREKKLEPVITPPVLPILEHLERDPSTLLPHEKRSSAKPRHFGGNFNVAPSGNGGLTASVSSSGSGAGLSQAASQSFSFGFNEGFSASHSASQSSSFNGFGSSSGFSGSQASSQAAAFAGAGTSVSGAASSAASFGGSSFGGSQSASQAFGFNTLNGFRPPDATFGDGLLDIRHRGVPNFPFPDLLGRTGRSKGIGAASFRSSSLKPNGDSVVTLFVSD